MSEKKIKPRRHFYDPRPQTDEERYSDRWYAPFWTNPHSTRSVAAMKVTRI